MAKLIRVAVATSFDKLADLIDAIKSADKSADISVESADAQRTSTAAEYRDDDDDDDRDRDVDDRPARRQSAAGRAPSTRPGGRVVYTPAGTQRQITRMLDDLRGVKTMRAFVLRDLAKHPGSSNADVRKRLTADAKRNGLSIESVDNVIWKLTKDGIVDKAAE